MFGVRCDSCSRIAEKDEEKIKPRSNLINFIENNSCINISSSHAH